MRIKMSLRTKSANGLKRNEGCATKPNCTSRRDSECSQTLLIKKPPPTYSKKGIGFIRRKVQD